MQRYVLLTAISVLLLPLTVGAGGCGARRSETPVDILSLPDVNPAYAAYQRDLDDRLKLMHCHLFATCFESEEFDAIAQCARDLSVKQYSAVVPSNYERCHQSRRVSNCDEFLSKKGCGSKWAVRFYTERELREWLKSSQAEYERYSKESKP